MEKYTIKVIAIDTKGEYKIDNLTMIQKYKWFEPDLKCECDYSDGGIGRGSRGPFDHDGKSCFVLHYINHRPLCVKEQNIVKPDGDTFEGTIWFIKSNDGKEADCTEADIERLRKELTRQPTIWNTYCVIL
jgi:hypothetical protein